jgi:hypothetical protein
MLATGCLLTQLLLDIGAVLLMAAGVDAYTAVTIEPAVVVIEASVFVVEALRYTRFQRFAGFPRSIRLSCFVLLLFHAGPRSVLICANIMAILANRQKEKP